MKIKKINLFKIPFKISCGIFAVLLSLPVSAAIYKWKDANNEVHYSTEAPANTQAQEIKPIIPTPPPAPKEKTVSEKEKLKSLNEQADNENRLKEEQNHKAQKEDEEEKIKNTNCERAKAHLEELESKGQVSMEDKHGIITHLTPEQKIQEIVDTKVSISKNCPEKR